MNSAQPDISVITVNYNGYHDTCEFIDSWVNTVTSVPYEIIVVDNGSTANEGLLLQQKYPSVHVIRSEQNLGFAGGNNLGIKSAKGNYLFLLNNDTLIVKDTVYLLIKRLLSSKGIAGISPLILNYTEPHTIQFAGYTPLSSITLRNRTIGRGSRDKSCYPARKTSYLHYNPQIQISAESETKRSIFREKDKTKRSKKESAQHSKSRNKSFVMTSVSAL